jgi:hypothetical protein
MSPEQVDALDNDTYAAFIRHMQREARELAKAASRRR